MDAQPRPGQEGQEPGLIDVLAPGGTIGSSRHGCIVIKGGPGLVIPIEPSAVLLEADRPGSLAGYDHVTVHSDLMVNVTRNKRVSRLELLSSRRAREKLHTRDRVRLLGAGVGVVRPGGGLEPGRHQTTYSGGSFIWSILRETRIRLCRQASLKSSSTSGPSRTPRRGSRLHGPRRGLRQDAMGPTRSGGLGFPLVPSAGVRLRCQNLVGRGP